MADKKISALTGASTPLAGTEVLPIVQSGATVKVAVSNLTAGRSVSAADYVMSTGNLIPSTAAKGINFTANTPAAGMTSQLLNWYEEGTVTPTWNGGTVTVNDAKYTRVGRLVTLFYDVTFGASASVSESSLTYPFSLTTSPAGGFISYTDYGVSLVVSIDSTGIHFRTAINTGTVTCAGIAGKRVIFTALYFA